MRDRQGENKKPRFGNLAIIVLIWTLDPWLCAPPFRKVYPCRSG